MLGKLVLREDREQGVTVLRLNDPEKRNAMSEDMAEEFLGHIEIMKEDRKLRVVVLTGEGKAFSGGGNLDMLFEKTKKSSEENKELMEKFYKQFLSIRELQVPVIAAINGHAIGAGLCVTLACDIRVAAKEAKLGLNFVRLGLHPGMGATYFLAKIVGRARAAELLYTGKIITADEAAELGLVNHVVEGDSFDALVEDLTKQIATAGPQSVRELKASLEINSTASLPEALTREAQCQALDYAGQEFLEGITAAKEKRMPEF